MADYNASQVSISIGGVPISGFGENTMISVEWEEDITTEKVGVDGEVTASKTNNLMAMATITLMDTSPSNAVMSGFYLARQQGDNATGVVPFFMEDGITGEVIEAEEAWVKRAPSVEKGRENTEREWTVRLAKARYAHLGNSA